MNKSELVTAVAEMAELKKKDAEKAVDSVLCAIEDALVKGDKVQLVGFGSFSVKKREAREGRNPQTGAKMKIKASRMPSFKAGKSLKDAVNK